MLFRNVDGEKTDPVAQAQRSAVMAPDANLATNPLEKQDVALFVNGKRISVLEMQTHLEGDKVGIVFVTNRAAIESPGGDAKLLEAWGDFKAGDTVCVKKPGLPRMGVLYIKSVRPPVNDGDPAFFIGEALTSIVDMASGDVLAAPGNECEIDTRFVVKQ